jgi:pilus assembly protein CpaC
MDQKRQCSVLWLLLLFLISIPMQTAFGEEMKKQEMQRLTMISGRSQVIDIPFEVKRVTVGDPEIADVIVLSPSQIYILGKGLGMTNLLLQGEGRRQMIVDLAVEADLTQLKEKLHELLPGEQIEAYSAKEGILLKGEVSSASALSTALSIAEPFAPKRIVNLMQVGGLQQVLLEVRVAEVSRTALNRLGFNFQSVVKDTFFGLTNLGGALTIDKFAATLPDLTLSNVEAIISPNTNAVLGAPRGHIITFLDALKENGLMKIMAEPNLMAVSGQEATFLAGGEFPIPVPQTGATNTITIEYKKFGVQLKFTPTVLNSEKINLKVAPEVSEIDFSTAVRVGGFVVPGVTTRGVSTSVELMEGHTLAIAGLIREDARNLVSKFPILGDIPILGMLFRSTSFQKNETELVILVTPRLVKSLGAPETVSLPTDRYPGYERELLGYRVNEKEIAPPPLRGGMEGEFGHSQ